MAVDLVVTNATVVTGFERHEGAGVAVRDGKIVAIGETDSLPSAEVKLDADGRILVPGIIDCHIHTREPGQEYKEDWQTATAAAAAGGVTSVFAMPNTDPVIDRPSRLRDVFSRADDAAIVDYQSYGVITSSNLDQVEPLASAGAIGFKVFLGSTVGDVPPPTDGELLTAMDNVRPTGRRVGFHEENGEIIDHIETQYVNKGKDSPKDHANSRPVVAEVEAINRMICFAADRDVPIHMFHVSSGDAARAVARGKRRGVDVTAETTPHYLWFDEEVLDRIGNVAKVNPPLRTPEQRERLWEVGVHGSAIDCFATDHAPHTDDEKGIDHPLEDTWQAMSGFVGLETAVPAFLTFVSNGELTLDEWVYRHSIRPAQIWDVYPEKGSLRIGTDADFTIVDPEATWTLSERSTLRSKSTVTPFEGETFTGSVYATVVRGSVVYEDGTITKDPGYGSLIEPN